MQRSIDRLLKSTEKDNEQQKKELLDKNGKVKFDRRKFDQDMYGSILSKTTGFDYTKLKVKPIKQTKEVSKEDASTTDGSKQ